MADRIGRHIKSLAFTRAVIPPSGRHSASRHGYTMTRPVQSGWCIQRSRQSPCPALAQPLAVLIRSRLPSGSRSSISHR